MVIYLVNKMFFRDESREMIWGGLPYLFPSSDKLTSVESINSAEAHIGTSNLAKCQINDHKLAIEESASIHGEPTRI